MILYCSPTGTGDGLTEGTPCSIESAKAACRSYQNETVRIYLLDGRYDLSSTFAFTNVDTSPSGYWREWVNHTGAEPIFDGGIRITGWTLHDVGKNIWKASVPVGTITRQVYVNGVKAQRARLPVVPTLVYGGEYSTTHPLPNPLSNPTKIEFLIDRPAGKWYGIMCRVATTSQTSGVTTFILTSDWGHRGISYLGRSVLAENCYDFLSWDTYGQWYLDEDAATLYYVPKIGETVNSLEIVIPKLDVLVSVQGTQGTAPVERITFTGITFRHSTWLEPSTQGHYLNIGGGFAVDSPDGGQRYVPECAFNVRGANSIKIYDCKFENIGGNGVNIGAGKRVTKYYYNPQPVDADVPDGIGTKNCTVRGCEFYEIVNTAITGGLTVGSKSRVGIGKDNENILIQYNKVHKFGWEGLGGPGIFIGDGINTKILSNEVYDGAYTGILCGFFNYGHAEVGIQQGMEIAYNLVYDCLKHYDDGSCIYTSEANRVDNIGQVHDNYVQGQNDGTCIYLDEYSKYIHVYNNVCIKYSYGIMQSWYVANTSWTPSENHHNSVYDNYAETGLSAGHWSLLGLEGVYEAPTYISNVKSTWPQAVNDIVARAGIVIVPVNPYIVSNLVASNIGTDKFTLAWSCDLPEEV